MTLETLLGSGVAPYGLVSITPAQLVANTDDWSPPGLDSTIQLIRVSTDASRNLTGLTGGVDGRTIYLRNIGTNGLFLIHDQTSTAANRFYFGNATAGNAVMLFPKQTMCLIYDGILQRWCGVSPSLNGAAVPLAPSGAGTSGGAQWLSREDHVHPANDIAVDTIWNAAGDIAYATGADVATILALGTAFRQLRVNSGATAPEWIGGLSLIGDSGVLGASATTIDFSSISGSYAHLIAFYYLRADEASATRSDLRVRINNISTATYDDNGIVNIGITVTGDANAAESSIYMGDIPGPSAAANHFGAGFMVFPMYADGSNRKAVMKIGGTIVTETSTTTAWELDMYHGVNRANTAISRLTFGSSVFGTTNFVAGSRITLYGLGV